MIKIENIEKKINIYDFSSNEKKEKRVNKLAKSFKRSIYFLMQKMKDPRIDFRFVNIGKVWVSSDVSLCRVYVSSIKNNTVKNDAKVLNKASGFFRANIAKELKLKKAPRFEFIIDLPKTELFF